ncbi:hypothetical protein DSO57_1011931 [Entomophthora muscae]|uniref:Uncharacterized protein n=1 Tax=Entomophthora muscae TaxID=34485 RepID=A0ACC2T690_9FUNG|nr:hypothetical protein DSO57_1011931 [Entomophthora muscae]
MENTNLRSPGPSAPLPAVFRPSGAPFGPVHFTDYPLKPKYKDYTPKKILELDPLACIPSAIRYNCQGLWIFSTPKLFRGKFNYLLAYNIYMEPPITPKPMPASSTDLPTNHTSKLFWNSLHHPHRGGGHHCTSRWPVVLGGDFCFLPSKVSSSLVVGQPPETGSLTSMFGFGARQEVNSMSIIGVFGETGGCLFAEYVGSFS